MLKISHNIKAVADAMQQLSGRQATFATAVALTRTAQAVKKAQEQEMARKLDRPTPYTMRGLFMQGATRQRLEARVWVKDDRAGSGTPADRYLLPQIAGGARTVKRFERALQLAGHMPAGWQAVPATGPGAAARLDAYGNVSKGQIIQILSQLRVTLTAGYTRNLAVGNDKKAKTQQRRAYGRAGGQYVALPQGRGKLKPGIYLVEGRDFGARVGYGRTGRIKPVFLFVRASTYRSRWDWIGVGERVVAAEFPKQFAAAFEQAMATAQPRGQGRLL